MLMLPPVCSGILDSGVLLTFFQFGEGPFSCFNMTMSLHTKPGPGRDGFHCRACCQTFDLTNSLVAKLEKIFASRFQILMKILKPEKRTAVD